MSVSKKKVGLMLALKENAIFIDREERVHQAGQSALSKAQRQDLKLLVNLHALFLCTTSMLHGLSVFWASSCSLQILAPQLRLNPRSCSESAESRLLDC